MSPLSGRAKPKFVALTSVGKVALFEGTILERNDSSQCVLLQTEFRLEERRSWNPTWEPAPEAVVGSDGRLKLFKVLTTMYLRPWESPAMVRLAYETRLALDALERIAEPNGPLFGGD